MIDIEYIDPRRLSPEMRKLQAIIRGSFCLYCTVNNYCLYCFSCN